MPWVTHGRRRYYYRPYRIGGRPSRQYLGSGPKAEEAAAEVERRRVERAARADALRADEHRHAETLGPLEELCALTDLAMRAALVNAGYRQHSRGVWRRRRHGAAEREAAEREGLPGGAARPDRAG